MSNPVSMFYGEDGQWSATRTVAIWLALVVGIGLLTVAAKGHFHDLGWPTMGLVSVTLLAVPVQALCKALAKYFESGPGRAMLKAVTKQVGAAVSEKIGLPGAATQTVNVNPTPEGEQG